MTRGFSFSANRDAPTRKEWRVAARKPILRWKPAE
jgi:hypothetical protein